MPVTIFSRTIASSSADWAGFNLRLLIPASYLSAAPGTNAASLSFLFASSNSGATIDSAYIGHQGSGNDYNFDGNQVQLKFAGSASLSGLGASAVVTSDYAVFSYDVSKPLVFSAHFSGGGSVNLAYLADGTTTNATAYYQSLADLETGVSAPAGSYTTQAGRVTFVNLVQMTGLATAASFGAADVAPRIRRTKARFREEPGWFGVPSAAAPTIFYGWLPSGESRKLRQRSIRLDQEPSMAFMPATVPYGWLSAEEPRKPQRRGPVKLDRAPSMAFMTAMSSPVPYGWLIPERPRQAWQRFVRKDQALILAQMAMVPPVIGSWWHDGWWPSSSATWGDDE